MKKVIGLLVILFLAGCQFDAYSIDETMPLAPAASGPISVYSEVANVRAGDYQVYIKTNIPVEIELVGATLNGDSDILIETSGEYWFILSPTVSIGETYTITFNGQESIYEVF